MKLLLTSDTQSEFSNLDNCEISLQEFLKAIDLYKPDVVIHAGDAKDSYNPCDLRVVKFWIRATRLISSKCRFIILKGNHDRISQSVESKDWLDILRSAGAETVSSKPAVKYVGDEVIGFLPYTSDKKQEREWAAQLAKSAKGGILIFHTEVAGAMFDNGLPIVKANTPEALCFDQYKMCFGGHIHKHQKIGTNSYYVGSPFSMSWSDTNQTKGHLLVDGNKIKQLKTSIPRWFDVGYLEKHGITPEAGAYVRSKVEVSTKKISDQLRKEEARIIKLFGDKVRPFVVPKIIQVEDDSKLQLLGTTDKDKIFEYVAFAMPGASRFDAKTVGSYMSSRLGDVGCRVCNSEKISFDSLHGENVLSFKSININYQEQGLVLIKGINKDWPKRSNGAGKSNALSLLSIALFGNAIKDQKHDAWASERNEDTAELTIRLTDDSGRKIEIYRSRRPHKILLRINGKDQSSGITGKGKDETQGHITKLIGYDYKALLNGVYVDQTIANSFVFGTNSVRTDLVAKIINLERFQLARDAVSKDISKNEKAYDTLVSKVEQLEEDVARMEAEIVDISSSWSFSPSTSASTLRKQVQKLVDAHAAIAGTKSYYEEVQRKIDDCEVDYNTACDKVTEVAVQIKSWMKWQTQGEYLVSKGTCPSCGQPSEKVGEKWIVEATEKLAKLTVDKHVKEKELTRLSQLKGKLDKELASYKEKLRDVDSELDATRRELAVAEQAEKEDKLREAKQAVKRERIEKELVTTKKQLAASQSLIHKMAIDREMLEFAKKGFGREGMPLYISASLCPVLNKAALDYSELLTDGKLSINFSVTDGEFLPSIINPAGSTTTDGQSTGEGATAGLIGALAVREIQRPKTNLLILDEPGHGLDSEGAKIFARSLLKLKDRFETILITTHSPVIESVLSGERVWVVEKTDGVSRLVV